MEKNRNRIDEETKEQNYREYRYQGTFEAAQNICDYITSEKIASLN